MNKSFAKRLTISVVKLRLILYMEVSKGFDILSVLTVSCNFPVFMDFHGACYFSSHPVCFHLFQTKLHSPNTEDKD